MNWKIITDYPDPELEQRWMEFLANSNFASHYTTPNFFIDPGIRGGERFAILLLEGSQVNGVLTAIDDGKRIISGLPVRPQTAFRRGIDLIDAARALLEGLREKGGKSLQLISFYTWEPNPEFERMGFHERLCDGDNAVIMIDLAKGAEQIFKEFSQTRRNEIRKAIKQNLIEIKELETDGELRELYQISLDWHRRKGIEPDSFEKMEIAVAQKENRKVFIAKHEGKVIAGSSYRFCKGGLVEYSDNNSLVEFQKFRPNDLIGWRSIEWACENGFTHYSMGGSHLFLRRFGGEIISPYSYKLDLTVLKVHNMRDGFIDLAIKTYRSLPIRVKGQIKKIAGKSKNVDLSKNESKA